MYSEPSTSSIEERVRRICAAAKYQPSANAGMIRCNAVPEPDDGSQPRYTEKNRISTRPTQNDGSDRPSSAKTFPALSQNRPTLTAARIPLGMPMTSENTIAAAHMRLTRSSMLEVLGSEYVKLARLKGLPEALVIAKHAFKNALIPVLTLAGINLVIMINVAVVVETVFAWPGIGRLLYEGITFRDFPVVQAVVLLGGIMIVVVNLVIDILYAVIDPRIRLGT